MPESEERRAGWLHGGRGLRRLRVGPTGWLLLLTSLAVCDPQLTPQEACEQEGGSWYEDGCGGDNDLCGAVICEVGVALGCHCDQPGQCWNGDTCVGSPPPPEGDGGGLP